MVEKQVRPKAGQLPLGLLGAIALIFAIELGLSREKLATLGGSQWAYEIARLEADSGDTRSEVLCFGDSLLKQGLAPTVIEASSGLRGYNFALAGGQAPGHYFLLRRALESGSRPKAIVVEYFPKLMATDPDFNMENWPMVANPGDCFEMSRLARDPNIFADLALREFLPSIRFRNSIRANLLASLDGTFSTYAREIESVRRNWQVNRGAEIVASRPGRIEDVETWMRGYFPSFGCTKTNRNYIKKFLDLARSRDIPVFWVLPPYKPELQARCEQSGFDREHEAFIQGLMARYPGLRVIDGRRSGYDPGVFTDLHHLGREGAAIFSAEVATLLRRHRDEPVSTPRWLKLPDYRAVATVLPLEDMDDSRRKIADIAGREATSVVR